MNELFGGNSDYPFDWDVYTAPVMDGETEEPDFHKIKRTDTHKTLHIATKRYNPIKNEQFMDTIDTLVSEFDCKIESSGSFKDGKEVFVQMTNNEFVDTIIPGDKHGEVKGYVTLVNSHNGGLAFRFFAGAIRIWCKNTFGIANRYANVILSVKHTVNAKSRVKEFADNIAEIGRMQKNAIYDIKEKAEVKSFSSVGKFAEDLYRLEYKPRPQTVTNDKGERTQIWTPPQLSTRGSNLKTKLVDTYDNYTDINEGNWRMFNAVTDVIDHQSSEFRQKTGYALFGGGATLKGRAYDMLFS
tara:strand:- start:24759 stop:25655 length:897 start_codon:yes stop_codon:yes gene_type:complete